MNKRFPVLLFVLGLCACSRATVVSQTPIPTPTLTPVITAIPKSQTPNSAPEPSRTPTAPPPPFPTLEIGFDNLSVQNAGLLPEFRAEISDHEMVTRYWIDIQVEFDPENEVATIDGMARIRFTNQGQEDIDEIILMLWPNHEQYQAEMTAGPLLINNTLVEPEFDEGNLYLQAPLVPELRPGTTIDLSLPFKVIASGSIGEIGLKRFGISYSIFAAPTFYPLVPRLIDGEWQKEAASEVGDTTNSDIAFYEVTITAPVGLDLIASGVEVADSPPTNDYQSKTFITGPMRDFAFVLGPFEKIERNVDGVDLNGWVLPGHIEDGEIMMAAATQQFSLLVNLIGPYPYPELDLVDVPGGFGGIEYPGLVFIGTLGEFDIIDPTVHEVAHQWFYGLIGNDQLIEPWLDEGASRYAQVLYYEKFVSSGHARSLMNYDRAQLWAHQDPTLPIGLEVTAYDSPRDYVLFVYSKGALFFNQMRLSLGEEKFIEFLRTYYGIYHYGFATSEGFQDTAEAVCSCDLDELFSIWVLEGGEMPSPGG